MKSLLLATNKSHIVHYFSLTQRLPLFILGGKPAKCQNLNYKFYGSLIFKLKEMLHDHGAEETAQW